MRSLPARTLVAACLATALAGPARAQYRIEQFTSNNGLPQNTVSGIAQTPDGYLWISTYDGLARYDGVTFTLFDRATTPEMPLTQFTNVRVDGAGALWAGTRSGVLRLRDGVFKWFTPVSGPGNNPAGDGRVQPEWVATPAPKWRVEGRELIDASGESVLLPATNLRLAGDDRAGGVWMFNQDSLIRFANGRFAVIRADTLLGTRSVRAGLVDREGTLWLGSNEAGLYRITRQILRSYSKDDGLFDRIVYPVNEDRDGRVWMSAGRGLSRWARGQFTSFLVVRAPDGRYQLAPAASGPLERSVNIGAMYTDRSGTVWLSVSNTLLAVRNDAIVRTYTLPEGNADVLFEDRDGVLWAGTGRGVVRMHGDSIRAYGSADGLPERAGVSALIEDSRGTLWAGTREGIARRDGDRWVGVKSADGRGENYVRSLYVDRDGGLWIGTFDAGLSRYKNGKFITITTRDGLFSNGVFHILEDDRGQFWMSCNRGIFRVSRTQLDNFADGKASLVISSAYGARDGMKSTEANGGREPAGVRARDGRLWFPTQDGVVVIDPSAVDSNPRTPAVALNRVRVDGAVRALGAVRLAPGEENLEIGFTAPSSVNAENIHFRYRLDGLDAGWTEAGTTRQVSYAHLPPGAYDFEVIAANSDGAWSVTPVTMHVQVDPHIYQTTWFLATVLLMIAMTAGGGYTLRVRALKAQKRVLTSLVAERTAELQVANDRLQQLATEDGLTGLANKRRFDEFIAQEWRRSIRAKTPIALLLIDVDHFKPYNDTYGHLAGDECLRRVAGELGAHIRRGTDLAARYGGEEFAIVLTNSSREGALVVAEKIRSAVDALGLPHSASSAANHVTVSIGVAMIAPVEGAAHDRLIADADVALYRAKDEGRNRVR